jgi:uncharacterized protein
MVTILKLRVTPNSSHNSVVGEVSDEIRIKIRARAVAGKANATLIEYLAELTGIAKPRIEIKAGARTRTKLVQFDGIHLTELRRRLGVDA